jgi:putative phosphoesterase
MKIGILSDTHGRTATVRKALRLIEAHDVELLIHCGDIDDDETALLFPAHTHFVFGNCDFDRHGIRRAVKLIGGTLHEPYGRLELAGKTIGFVHGDHKKLLLDLETGQDFDYLFYGHTHQALEHRTGKTRVINPGALQRARPKSCAILDLKTGVLESVIVEAD